MCVSPQLGCLAVFSAELLLFQILALVALPALQPGQATPRGQLVLYDRWLCTSAFPSAQAPRAVWHNSGPLSKGPLELTGRSLPAAAPMDDGIFRPLMVSSEHLYCAGMIYGGQMRPGPGCLCRSFLLGCA